MDHEEGYQEILKLMETQERKGIIQTLSLQERDRTLSMEPRKRISFYKNLLEEEDTIELKKKLGL